MNKIAAAAALILLPGTGFAAPDKTAPESERKVCVSEAELGTRLGRKKVCRTVAEWRQLRQDSQQIVQGVQFDQQQDRIAEEAKMLPPS